MRSTFQLKSAATALGLLAAAGMCPAQVPSLDQARQIITDLQVQNQTLQRSLAEANRGEKQATEQLTQVRERLEALGKNLLDGGDDRLIQAAADSIPEGPSAAAMRALVWQESERLVPRAACSQYREQAQSAAAPTRQTVAA